jgi:hypothetical protein
MQEIKGINAWHAIRLWFADVNCLGAHTSASEQVNRNNMRII